MKRGREKRTRRGGTRWRGARTSSGQCLGCPSSGHLVCAREQFCSLFSSPAISLARFKAPSTTRERGERRSRRPARRNRGVPRLNGDTFRGEPPLAAAKPIYLRPRFFPRSPSAGSTATPGSPALSRPRSSSYLIRVCPPTLLLPFCLYPSRSPSVIFCLSPLL